MGQSDYKMRQQQQQLQLQQARLLPLLLLLLLLLYIQFQASLLLVLTAWSDRLCWQVTGCAVSHELLASICDGFSCCVVVLVVHPRWRAACSTCAHLSTNNGPWFLFLPLQWGAGSMAYMPWRDW
jgi:hypothetical protein